MDGDMLEAVERSVNMTVPWFLMASWLYYHQETSLLSDYAFDHLCVTMVERWSEIKHQHKNLIGLSDLKAGTGYTIPDHKYPLRIKSAALSLLSKETLDLMQEERETNV